MGRETKILLGFLGLLAGVFVGVLSMKLLVPRPPQGAGPDVHGDLAVIEPHAIVEPPALTMRASDFAAAPPLVPPVAASPASPAAEPSDRYATAPTAFAGVEPASRGVDVPPPRRDPFVAAASFQGPEEPLATEPPPAPPEGRPAAPAAAAFDPPATAVAVGGDYVVRTGDSWWSVAERAYGDGRLYRALFAWNRTADSRITLAPGTPLRIPPIADLAAAWPDLVPSAMVSR